MIRIRSEIDEETKSAPPIILRPEQEERITINNEISEPRKTVQNNPGNLLQSQLLEDVWDQALIPKYFQQWEQKVQQNKIMVWYKIGTKW